MYLLSGGDDIRIVVDSNWERTSTLHSQLHEERVIPFDNPSADDNPDDDDVRSGPAEGHDEKISEYFEDQVWRYTDNTKKVRAALRVGRTRTDSWSDDPDPPEFGEDGAEQSTEDNDEDDSDVIPSELIPLTQGGSARQSHGKARARWTGRPYRAIPPMDDEDFEARLREESQQLQDLWFSHGDPGAGPSTPPDATSTPPDASDGPSTEPGGPTITPLQRLFTAAGEESDTGSDDLYSPRSASTSDNDSNDLLDDLPTRDEAWHEAFSRQLRSKQYLKKTVTDKDGEESDNTDASSNSVLHI